ncbi:MAG: efflux RND transporter periplasmic adaptor subunit [Woeseiaceae bacterium]
MNSKRSENTLKLLAFLMTGSALLALSGCEVGNSAPVGDGETSALLVDVETAVPVSGYSIQREFVGRVEAARQSEVGFELGGELMMVSVDEGDEVKAGEVLAVLDTARLEARLAEAEAALAQAISARDLASRSYDRAAEASAEGAVAGQELDIALEGANSARAGVSAATARLNSVKVDLEKSRLLAPYDAVVIDRRADEGNIVASGFPVLHLQELVAPEIRIGVAGELAYSIAPDDTKAVTIGGRQQEAVVRAVLPVRDPATRTVDVILTLPDSSAAVPGDLARLDVEQVIEEDGYWLPTNALAEGSRGLWTANIVRPLEGAEIASNGATHIVEPRALEVLYKKDSSVFVRGAISAGEQFVTTGTQRIVPYQQVRVATAFARGEDGTTSHE